MIPLRHITIDATGIPELHQGSIMEAERSIILLLLDPDTAYYAQAIAQIAFTWELQQEIITRDIKTQIKRYRNAYCHLAERAGYGSNPEFTGRQWASLVTVGLLPLVELMDRLALAQEAEPGVLFTLHNGKLIHYPDQNASLAAPLPPNKTRIGRFTFPLAKTSEELINLEPESKEITEEAIPEPNLISLSSPHMATAKKRRIFPIKIPFVRRWQYLFLFLFPTVLFGYFWANIDEVYRDEIDEMGEPYQEVPFFLTNGRRYEPGDWVRFEGKVGVIKKINREVIIVDDHRYPAPPLYFFGQRMKECGNFVIYPGSDRHIAGSFTLDTVEDLSDLEPGYLSWKDGYSGTTIAIIPAEVATDFFSQVSGIKITSKGEKKIAIPEGTQFNTFLEDTAQAARVEQKKGELVISW